MHRLASSPLPHRAAVTALAVIYLVRPRLLVCQEPLAIRQEFVLRTPGLGVANAVIETRDGGFVAVGYADFGRTTGTDVVIARFDADGDTLWTRSYGADREDFGWDVVESDGGGFFVVGYTEAPTAGQEDVLVQLVDAAGAPVWTRTLGGAGRDRAWSATGDGNGGVVIAAESEDLEAGGRDAYVLDVGRDGTVRWSRTLQTPGDQRVFHVAQTDDHAFVFAGTTQSDVNAGRDVYVARISPEGEPVWERSFGDAPDDVGHGVTALQRGDVLITGYGATRSAGANDAYLIRLDARGTLQTWNHYGGPEDDRAMMSAATPTGGIVTVGYSIGPRGSDIIVIETALSGAVLARRVLSAPGNDRGVMILSRPDGSYVLAGTLGDSAPGDFAVLWLDR